MNTAEQEHYRTLTREEHVKTVPYVLLVFHTSNDNSESLFEEEPTEFYYKTFEEAIKAFYSISNASHLTLMEYGFNGNPEDGKVLDEWDETENGRRDEQVDFFPLHDWTLENYKDMFYYIEIGYLIQDEYNNYFVINPEWRGDPLCEDERFIALKRKK